VAYEPWVTVKIDLLSPYLHAQPEKETKEVIKQFDTSLE
jgi:hypothetical protein